MNIFKKKEKKCCCSNVSDITKTNQVSDDHGIKILGSGCAKCMKLEDHVKEALKQLNLALPVEHVMDFAKIASYGVMSTPALVLNGEVVSFGKVLSVDEVKHILLIKLKD